MKQQQNRNRLLHMVYLAVLVAILILLEVTGLGMIKTAGWEMTILQVPVLVGAIALGPTSGAFLGGVFGFISLWEGISGKSPFGAALFGINPVYFFILCVVTRILMGWLCGLIFKGLQKTMPRSRIAPFAVAALSGALLNTIFFMTAFISLFGKSDYVQNIQSMMGTPALFPFLIALVGLQGLVEAGICFFAGTALSRAIYQFVNKDART